MKKYEKPKKKGRPRKGRPAARRKFRTGVDALFEDPQELLDAINQYFIDGYVVKKVVVGRAPHQKVVEQPVISITGLALYLGYHSIQAFYKQQTRGDDFFKVVMYGKTMVAMHYEGLMQSGVSPTAMVFMLSSITGMKAESAVVDRGEVLRTINFVVPKEQTKKVIEIEAKESSND